MATKPTSPSSASDPSILLVAAIFSALAAMILVILTMSLVPPVGRDALTHHLAVPKLWIRHGSLVALPHLPFSYYPGNLNLLYLLPLLLDNDTLPKVIHFLFGLGTAWLIYAYLYSRTTRLLALLGALIFLSTPIIVKLSVSAYVDLGLVFFSWASIVCLYTWARSPQSIKPLIFSATLCGLGLGTKYNGMISLLLLTIFVPLIYSRIAGRRNFKTHLAIGYTILYFLIAMTMFSPWMVRNYRLTGNPVYPLYTHHLGKQDHSPEISNLSMKPWLQRKLIYREPAWQTALIPLRIFFQGQDDHPRYFDGKLNPMICLFPLLLLLVRRGTDDRLKLEQILLAAFAVLYILYASFMVDMRIRYIAPTIPPLVVLTVMGLAAILHRLEGMASPVWRKLGRCVTFSVFTGFLALNAIYVTQLFRSVDPVPYALGKISREAYLLDKLPEFRAIQFVNRVPDSNMKVMALFVVRRLYYYDRPFEFLEQTYAAMVKDYTDLAGLSLQLRERGYSHCVIGIAQFERWANRVFDDGKKRIVSQWLERSCQLLFSSNGYAVFKLIDIGQPPIPGPNPGDLS